MNLVVKDYLKAGINFIDWSIENLSNIGYIHPIIKINNEYSMETQGDDETNYLYGLQLYKNDNPNCKINLYEISGLEETLKFIKEFDKYQPIIESRFKHLNELNKIKEKLESYMRNLASFNKQEADSVMAKELEYATAKLALLAIYEDK